jgi:hypothetical protein
MKTQSEEEYALVYQKKARQSVRQNQNTFSQKATNKIYRSENIN